MEPNFQTSFIPKKPMIQQRAVPSRSVGLFTITSIFILFSVIIASGGLFFYKGVLAKSITSMSNDLEVAKNRFEPAKIAQLQVLDKRLNASSEILSSHISISPIFKALQNLTLKTVRYTKFTYSINDEPSAKVMVKMTGVALGYRSVALQADLFPDNKNIVDPVFSNLVLDDKGNVMFELTFSVDPAFVNYGQSLKVEDDSSEPSMPETGI
ncbi:MAG TPA: hypothetical protein VJC14_03270 [Candidatus Paceibacterota bacterium]